MVYHLEDLGFGALPPTLGLYVEANATVVAARRSEKNGGTHIPTKYLVDLPSLRGYLDTEDAQVLIQRVASGEESARIELGNKIMKLPHHDCAAVWFGSCGTERWWQRLHSVRSRLEQDYDAVDDIAQEWVEEARRDGSIVSMAEAVGYVIGIRDVVYSPDWLSLKSKISV